MIIKSKHFKNFTTIDNAILRDKSLSIKAKGLYAILSSLPPDWNVVQSQLHQFSNDGIAATTKAFKELIDYGIVRVVCKDAALPITFRGNVTYIVFPTLDYAANYNGSEQPDSSTLFENQIMENPIMENAIIQNDTLTNKVVTNKVNNKQSSNTYKQCIEVYFAFFKAQNNFPPRMNAAEGKAMKSIIEYLETCSSEQSSTLHAWQYVLDNWHKLNDYTRARQRLVDINSNIVNILVELKNKATQQPRSSGKINTAYNNTLEKLLHEKRNATT